MMNRKILVTGASGGLGSAIVRELLASGDTVYGLDLGASQVENDSYVHVECDITDSGSVERAVGLVSERTDRLDAIVNAAGIMFFGALVEHDPEHMDAIMRVNVGGMNRVDTLFFPLLERAKGRIINISSEYGRFCSLPFNGLYTASKRAVEAYSDSLRRELGYLGMKVVTIRPGSFATPMTSSTGPTFDRLVGTSEHFSGIYKRLKPMMINATKNAGDPSRLAKLVGKAVGAKRPRRVYRIKNDVRVGLLSVLPEGVIDLIFRRFLR
jgi:NAD(P)-dependent dehydrogenase (short-subunit alcohol dehydrogenase family)